MAPRVGVAKRVAMEALGWLLLVGGVAAIPLPGPGLLLVFAGLAVLSQQYSWAERRVEPVKEKALGAAAESVQTWPRIAVAALGALTLIAIGVVWGLRPQAPSWWPVGKSWWLFGGWGTGATLIFSGVVALGMLVYSFRNFRGDEPGERRDASLT